MDATSEHVLDNGLKVIIGEAHATPTACCSVWYRAGSKNESAGTTGLAHLLEHMMFKGTERFPKGEFDRILHKNGAINNASTWLDRTNYYELVSADRLELMLELEADRMRGALFNETDLVDEMPVVRNELERDDDDPYSNLFERMQSVAFLEHPYHWPTIGWRTDVEAIRAHQIREFYDRFYHPNNAFLVIVGDVATRDALKLVAKHFDGIPAGPEPPRPVTAEPPQKGERRVVVRKPGENDILGMAFKIPSRTHPDNYALDLLGQTLGQGRTSRLYKALVEKKLAVRASAVNYATPQDPFLFFIDAEVAEGVDPALVEEAVLETIEGLKSEPVQPSELDRAKKRNRVDFIYRRDRVSQQAFFLGELEISCGWRFGSTYLQEIGKLTTDDLREAANKYLVADSRIVGVYDAIRAGEDKPVSGTPQSATGDQAPAPLGAAARSTVEPAPPVVASRDAVRTHRVVLDNGIIALVRPNRSNQTVHVAGRIEGGLIGEGGQHGLTNAVTRMMDRGTKTHSRAEISEILEGLGAAVTLRSSVEVVGFRAKCLREDLGSVIPLMAEILLEPTFPAAEWDIVKRQIVYAIRESQQETFDRAFYKAMEMMCGAESVFALRVQGSVESVDAMKPPDMAALHRGFLEGRRMTVAVVGDVSVDEGVALIRDHLGNVPPGAPFDAADAGAVRTAMPEPQETAYEHVELPEKSQADFIVARPGVSRLDPSFDAASVANYILGGHFSSRLNKQLRDNEGLTYGTHSHLRSGRLRAPWYASIGVHPGNLQKAREGVLREMGRLAREGIEDAEFEDAIEHLTGSFPVRLETNEAVANMLLDGERYEKGPDVIETYIDRMRTIRKEDVEEQARRLFVPERVIMASSGTLTGGTGAS